PAQQILPGLKHLLPENEVYELEDGDEVALTSHILIQAPHLNSYRKAEINSVSKTLLGHNLGKRNFA
ncbi:hypothetical protein KC622_02995, partial [Candidatus Dojkabacteria bacterium]|nr:hypothetical protein [Candidatus Dojkabacteria bacterium]